MLLASDESSYSEEQLASDVVVARLWLRALSRTAASVTISQHFFFVKGDTNLNHKTLHWFSIGTGN